jgi:hypothetical protein
MKKLLRTIVVGIAAVLSCSYAAGTGFTPPLQIVGLDVGNTEALIIKFGANTECGTSLAYVPAAQPYYKDVLALASSAYITGQAVQVWVAACNWDNKAQVVRLVVGSVW